MSFVYFGHEPAGRGATKLAVKTTQGELEPVAPSRFKVFAHINFSPLWAIATRLMGLLTAIVSLPINSYINLSSPGLLSEPASSPLPFRTANLAVVQSKKGNLSSKDISTLDNHSFTSMQFAGRTVWLREGATREIFLLVDTMEGVDPLGPCPDRYLNTHSFRAWLTLLSFTTNILRLLDYLSMTGSSINPNTQRKGSTLKGNWKLADTIKEGDMTDDIATEKLEYEKVSVFLADSAAERTLASLVHLAGSSSGIAAANSGVIMNPGCTHTGFSNAGTTSDIQSPGFIMKFHPQLALPDINLIGDVIGRLFLAGLGTSIEEQLENLNLLKTGLSGLRLTRLGDELTHLFKCIEIAVDSYSGCFAIFSGGIYEGCVISGGPSNSLVIRGKTLGALTTQELRAAYLNVSSHSSALSIIASYLKEEGDRELVKSATNMWMLRDVLLSSALTQDERDQIIRHAANLDFGETSWVISPANLRKAFDLLTDVPGDGYEDLTEPIGRLSLFSKDPVLLALSCFGEKTAPSWDIPSGVQCSLASPNPPVPDTKTPRRGTTRGEISDAAWVMVVRQTDLFSAVDEFRQMAATLKYRSSSSVLAKRVGHRVFSRERMAEFWQKMREALRAVNPDAPFEGMGEKKRSATESEAVETGVGNSPVKKRQRMKF